MAASVLAIVAATGACSSLGGSDGVGALRVGDCIDQPQANATTSDVRHQPCNLPHDAEVFAVLTNPAGPDEPYPAEGDMEGFVQEGCVPLWETYTGRTWATEIALTISFLQPTVTDWADGDRGFSCYTTRYGGGKLIASVKNIGTSPLPAQTP